MSDTDETARCAVREPGAALAGWVSGTWYSADDRAGCTRERLLPRGVIELVIELGSGQASIDADGRRITVDPVSVSGASSRSFLLDRPNRFETIGVSFRPGAAFALLGIAAHELDSGPLPLGALWEDMTNELRERASAETGPREKLAAVEGVLARQLGRTERAGRYGPAIAAMSRIAAAPVGCGIADLSASVGLSRRRLEETFKVVAGMSPKRYQRLWRFRRALERVDHRDGAGWAAFALDAGCYDQSHFSNEFRHHAGLGPNDYLAARTSARNHLRIGGTRAGGR